ncbi:hypothetical protein Cgig2_004818 [Carnegiea gigantea]|uniref:Pyruvate kinase n=1 Tax=Carnegiea gigantea TaxID=171969 RepID=A0A9Q1QQV8_9CARY|nr:hypothetical protein Cgig2_004818 [Carnegiea gigantea]
MFEDHISKVYIAGGSAHPKPRVELQLRVSSTECLHKYCNGGRIQIPDLTDKKLASCSGCLSSNVDLHEGGGPGGDCKAKADVNVGPAADDDTAGCPASKTPSPPPSYTSPASMPASSPVMASPLLSLTSPTSAFSHISFSVSQLHFRMTTEVTTAARYICFAVPNLAVIADVEGSLKEDSRTKYLLIAVIRVREILGLGKDPGGGNALNVQRVVRDLIDAGAAGCFLEVVPAEEHALKIEAAREAIRDADFFLVAKTDARATSGLEEAISRANLYWEEKKNLRGTKEPHGSNSQFSLSNCAVAKPAGFILPFS